jgi:methylenetetrahydrofolate reductase (NADPH)
MDPAILRRYLARLREAGLLPGLAILVGLAPLRSAKSARWMREHLYGTIIPDALIERLEAAADPIAEGQHICVDLIEQMSRIEGVAGVHIMAPNNEAVVPAVAAEARKVLTIPTP